MFALTKRMFGVAALTCCIARSVAGQRLETPSFVFARYATRSAAALYAARGFGPVGGFVAMVQNPKTQYRELIAGALTRVTWSGQSVLVAVAYADATDSRYLQAYVNPSLIRGPFTLSGTLEWYEPLERAGTRQLYVNPATLLVRLSERLSVGAAYTVGLATGAPPQHRAGPVLEWAARWATFSMEILDRAGAESVEVRTGVYAAF